MKSLFENLKSLFAKLTSSSLQNSENAVSYSLEKYLQDQEKRNRVSSKNTKIR